MPLSALWQEVQCVVEILSHYESMKGRSLVARGTGAAAAAGCSVEVRWRMVLTAKSAAAAAGLRLLLWRRRRRKVHCVWARAELAVGQRRRWLNSLTFAPQCSNSIINYSSLAAAAAAATSIHSRQLFLFFSSLKWRFYSLHEMLLLWRFSFFLHRWNKRPRISPSALI